MTGKEKCEILREIRKRIAEENHIDLQTEDCGFEGECTGTCPKCEAELQYLEAELVGQGKADWMQDRVVVGRMKDIQERIRTVRDEEIRAIEEADAIPWLGGLTIPTVF